MAIPGAKAQLKAAVSIPRILQAPGALSAVCDSTEGVCWLADVKWSGQVDMGCLRSIKVGNKIKSGLGGSLLLLRGRRQCRSAVAIHTLQTRRSVSVSREDTNRGANGGMVRVMCCE